MKRGLRFVRRFPTPTLLSLPKRFDVHRRIVFQTSYTQAKHQGCQSVLEILSEGISVGHHATPSFFNIHSHPKPTSLLVSVTYLEHQRESQNQGELIYPWSGGDCRTSLFAVQNPEIWFVESSAAVADGFRLPIRTTSWVFSSDALSLVEYLYQSPLLASIDKPKSAWHFPP
jgi:hypothetical protein